MTQEKMHKMMRHAIENAITGLFWTSIDEACEGIDEALALNEIPGYCLLANNVYIDIEIEDEEVCATAYLGYINSTIWVQGVTLD